jgi:hypothetical protein
MRRRFVRPGRKGEKATADLEARREHVAKLARIAARREADPLLDFEELGDGNEPWPRVEGTT